MTTWSLADWSFEPGVVFGLIALTCGYWIGLRRTRPRSLWDQHFVSTKEVAFFASGVLLLAVALVSPLDTLSDTMFSAHMLQHMLLLYIVPPCLLVGVPSWLVGPALEWRGLKRGLRFLTNPIVAIAIFNGALVIWHLPVTWDAALVDNNIHALEHVTFLGAGIVAWWPVFSPSADMPRLSYPGQMLYLFVQSLVPAVIGAFVTFSGTVIYPVYGIAPKYWGLTPLVDQQIAGLLMKLLGTIFLWVLVTIRFFQWFNHEEHEIEKSVDDNVVPR